MAFPADDPKGQHLPVKPEKIVATGVAALEERLVVPALFAREGIEKFVGGAGDSYTVTVDGVLPYRSYGWRADRSADIVFDEYKERKVSVTFGDDIYSAVYLTDEQNTMDIKGWAKLASKQTEAIGRGLEDRAVEALNDAPYEVHVVLNEADLRGSLIKLRGVMNKLRVQGSRSLVIGDDIETALLSDDKLNLASNVGDEEAVTALREATIGRRYGFNFVTAGELASDEGVAMVGDGFVFIAGAPEVPQSVPFGAAASVNGVALRWIRDYDSTKFRDRSIFNMYPGFRYVDDPLVGKDGAGQAFVSEANHFVRAVKVTLGTAFEVEIGNSELANITGLTSTDGLNDGA